MPTESTRHYLLGPVSACLARMYLLRQSLAKAEQGKFTPKTIENMKTQLNLLEEKLTLLQNRITESLPKLPETAPAEKTVKPKVVTPPEQRQHR